MEIVLGIAKAARYGSQTRFWGTPRNGVAVLELFSIDITSYHEGDPAAVRRQAALTFDGDTAPKRTFVDSCSWERPVQLWMQLQGRPWRPTPTSPRTPTWRPLDLWGQAGPVILPGGGASLPLIEKNPFVQAATPMSQWLSTRGGTTASSPPRRWEENPGLGVAVQVGRADIAKGRGQPAPRASKKAFGPTPMRPLALPAGEPPMSRLRSRVLLAANPSEHRHPRDLARRAGQAGLTFYASPVGPACTSTRMAIASTSRACPCQAPPAARPAS